MNSGINMKDRGIDKKKLVVTVIALAMSLSAFSLLVMQPAEAQVGEPYVITGYVKYEDGTPVANALVWLKDVDTGVENQTYTDASGRYVISFIRGDECFEGDWLIGRANDSDGYQGTNDTYFNFTIWTVYGWTSRDTQWLNFTIDTPITTKTITDVCPERNYDEPRSRSWITSDAIFNFTATDELTEGGVNATYVRIWYNGEWYPAPGTGKGKDNNFWVYGTDVPDNFTFNDLNELFGIPVEEGGIYYVEYYSDDANETEEYTHNQTHIIDDTPPVYEINFGTTIYKTYDGERYPVLKSCDPIEIHVNDSDGSGVTELKISVYRGDSPYGTFTLVEGPIIIYDNDLLDENDEFGKISYTLEVCDVDCFHKIVIERWDCVGNYAKSEEYFIIDATPPTVTKEIGKPYVEPGVNGPYSWVNFSTPFWINATDDGCLGGVGVDYIWLTIWNDPNITGDSDFVGCWIWNKTMGDYEYIESTENFKVYDGSDWDLNEIEGVVSIKFRFAEECLHEIHFGAVDKLGNEAPEQEQRHYVDNTPPGIMKRVPKVVMVEQTEWNNASWVNTSYEELTENWQSFIATWSYIDAVSIYINGTVDVAYPTIVEIWDATRTEKLAETEPINISGEYHGWVQLHLLNRLYVTHGETYWIRVNSTQWMPLQWNASDNNPYPDGYAIVNGVENYSWDFTFKIEYYPYFKPLLLEDFTNGIPTDWYNTYDPWSGYVWKVEYTDDAGGTIPEAIVYWADVSDGDMLYTTAINTTGYTSLILSFKTFVDDWDGANHSYTLHVATSTDASTWNDVWSISPTEDYGPSTENIVLTSADGVGSPTLYIAFIFTGDNLGLDYWCIDDVVLYAQPLYSYFNSTISWDGLNDTYITSEAFFNLTAWDEGCNDGVGLDSLEYRIWKWDYDNEMWILQQDWTNYTGEFNIPDNCTHKIEIRAKDLLGNTRIIEQIHHVDNLPPRIDLLLPECEYYYNETEDKEYLQAGANITLKIMDEPIIEKNETKNESECAVGIRYAKIYFRYEYHNYTTGITEYYPSGPDDYYYTDYGVAIPVWNVTGNEMWWWLINATQINISFNEECRHDLYYFYDASDWLDSTNEFEIYHRTFYVDTRPPVITKEHPEHGYYDAPGIIILHGWSPYRWDFVNGLNGLDAESPYEYPYEIYPDFGKEYMIWDADTEYKNWTDEENYTYWKLIDMETGKAKWYHILNYTLTLNISNETFGFKYIEYAYNESGVFNPDEAMYAPNGSYWYEVYPTYLGQCVACNGYQITNWTDNGNGYLDKGDYINITVYNTTNETRWYVEDIAVDITLEPVDYLKVCTPIELRAEDQGFATKLVDQEQTEHPCFDLLQPREGYPIKWDYQGFKPQIPEVEGEPGKVRLSAISLGLWNNKEPANVTVYIYDENWTEIANVTKEVPVNGGPVPSYIPLEVAGQWVQFEFDTKYGHDIILDKNKTYYIAVTCDKEDTVHWYFECYDEDLYPNGTAVMDNTTFENFDWTFKTEYRVHTECVAGIEGIYWAYVYNDIWHPMNMTDYPDEYIEEYGEDSVMIINISKYYDDDVIEEEFGGHYLWYWINKSITYIHFYEECRHDLYYWAKDNVCHHTPVYHQVYFLDDTEPVVEKIHPDHGYYEPLNESFEYCFLPPGWTEWSYAWIPDYGQDDLPVTWQQTSWENHTKAWARYHGNYSAVCRPYDIGVVSNETLVEQWTWLITPQIILPAEATITFYHRANDTANDTLPNYLMISTVDKRQEDLQPEDFETLIEFPAGSLPSDWTKVEVDLSDYAGKPVYIAWVYHSKVGHFNVSINETTNKTYYYGETWYLDKVRITPAYLRCCARINLTAEDYPPEKTIDQQQITYEDYKNIYLTYYASQGFTPYYPVIDAVQLALWGPTCANVTVRIYYGAQELGNTTLFLPPMGSPDEPVWVQFHFEAPIILPTYHLEGNGYDYHIIVSADNEYYWFYNSSSDSYSAGEGYWYLNYIGDFAFKTEYYDFGCVAGLEGIYWGYEYNGAWHPNSMDDNTTLHGDVINISKYYNDTVIQNEFDGHYLWYVYNDSLGIHFYEECRHDLYYWAKDNVCHHTPVYHQVYYVDNSEPIIDVEYPDCGYRNATVYEKADLVFIVDTSESMAKEWTILDSTLSGIINDLISAGRDINVTVYALNGTLPDYPTANISAYLKNLTVVWYNGENISVDNITGGLSADRETWAPAAAWAAQFHPWRNDTIKIIVVISDENAYNGAPSDSEDWQAVYEARDICINEEVAVFGFYSTGREPIENYVLPDVKEQMENLSIPTLENLSITIPGVYNLSDADAFTSALMNIVNVSMRTRTYLRMGAKIWINATDMPDNECSAGLAGIYWRWEYEDKKYPNEEDYNNWQDGYTWPYPSNVDDIVYMYDEYWFVDTDGCINISFDEECIHTLYWFAKDTVCHSTPIYNETYYVDGTPPDTTIEDMTTNCTEGPHYIIEEGHSYWQACDWINISFNVTNPGEEPCKYPETIIVNGTPVPGIYTFVRYERKIWNDSLGDFEIIKYPSSLSDELPEWANGIEEWFGEYWYNISITKYINITEGCNHTIYYFSKDPLCNTEEIHTIEVHVDDAPPKTEHYFVPSVYFESIWANKVIYLIGKNTLIGLDAEDYPIGCDSGVETTWYRIWRYDPETGEFNIDLTGGWVEYDGLINLSELVGDEDVCGAYEIWYYSEDNCCHVEDKHLFDVIVDCLPPDTTKEFAGKYVKGKIENISVTFVGRDTIIWLNSTDIWLAETQEWRSGVDTIYWRIVNETVDETFFATNPDDEAKDFSYPIHMADLIDLLGLKDDRYDFFHWAVDRVGNEEQSHHKQWIIIDVSPPEQTIEPIIPYTREKTPFLINGTVAENGPYGGVGLSRIDIYYRYRPDNDSEWSEPVLIYSKVYDPDDRVQYDEFSFLFNAPEGGGYYRFYSNAIDLLGNNESQSLDVEDYEAECYVKKDTEPPEVVKTDGEPKCEIIVEGEPITALTWDTPIYIDVTDLPDPINASGVEILRIAFTTSADGPASDEWFDVPKYLWEVVEEGNSGYYKIRYTFTLEEYRIAANLQSGVMYHIYVYAEDKEGYGNETKAQKLIIDDTPPTTTITLECDGTMPFNITVSAYDYRGIGNITLYFRYSPDNSTWTEWMPYGSVENVGCGEEWFNYTWLFIYNPDGGYYKPGYYEFYAYAEDSLGNAKDNPEITNVTAEARCYVEPLPEDFNADGHVDVYDLLNIINNWGIDESSPEWEEVQQYDLDNSGDIGLGDLIALIKEWTG